MSRPAAMHPPLRAIPLLRAIALLLAIALLPAEVGCRGDPVQPEEWHEGPGFRWRELAVPGRGGPGFRSLRPSRTGIDFVNTVSEELLIENQILENGSGVAIGDVTGNGLPDIYLARLEGPNALYRNLGNWRFEEIAREAGVAAEDRHSTGVVMADVNGDGHLDILLTSIGGPVALFLNDGTGRFREVTEEAGLGSGYGSTTMALADVNGNGALDLYVTNYKRKSVRDLFRPDELTLSRTIARAGDSIAIAPEFREHYELVWRGNEPVRYEVGEPDLFYLNDGSGRFEAVPFDGGRFLDADGTPLGEAPRDWGLAARFHDLTGDGAPDLYVCNDFQTPDRIWLNDGSGAFRAVPPLAIRTISASCMAVDFADVDLDGQVDVFTVDMMSRDGRQRRRHVPVLPVEPALPGEIETRQLVQRNALQWNRGDGTYAEVAHYADVAASEWSWSAVFLDVDLDGYEDILVSNGHLRDIMDVDTQRRALQAVLEDRRHSRLFFGELRTRNVAFRNEGGLRFTEAGEAWGFGAEPDISHGMALGDLDGDGDLDVVVNRMGAPALVLRNEAMAPRVAVRLEGRPPNTQGIGSTIRVLDGPVPEQRKEVSLGGAYLSSSEPIYAFAVGRAEELTIVVEWRSGARSRVEGVRPNRLYVVQEPEPARGEAEFPPPEGSAEGPAAAGRSAGGEGPDRPGALSRPAFREVPLDHLHVDAPYDDFRRQPLLPLRLSQLGPGVAWHDVDGDGRPDLLIASGRGGTLSLFRNVGGELRRVVLRTPEAPLDQTTVLGLPSPGGGSAILVGQMNYEATDPETARRVPSVLRFDLDAARPGPGEAEVTVSAAVPGHFSGTGPLALADVNGNGALDLFVGGRALPAAYPVPAVSRLFTNEGGRFVEDSANAEVLTSLGLVSSAVFSDVDGDGAPDLLLALDWGPIVLLRNRDGRFVDETERWGLAGITNRWNGITTGDLTGDGRPDIIATAWGENTGLQASPRHPLRLHYGDFDADGTTDVVLAAYDAALGDYAPVVPFDRLGRALPYVRERVRTFSRYAVTPVGEALGSPFREAETVEATRLDHVLFLNRGDRFEAVPLPPKAQLAPAFYVGVADLDGDGHEDVFLAQNFFATDPGTERYESGRGLWLRGDGTGRLEPVPGRVSGIRVYGEQRGAALGDYDGDGRVDLVISQNAAPARLFRNEGAAPGLRVRLVGPPGNPYAVGAAVRVVYDDGRGPLREVKAGSGYWSQDDPVQVLGLRERPRAVWVRWPGGRESEHPVPPEAREVILRMPAAAPP